MIHIFNPIAIPVSNPAIIKSSYIKHIKIADINPIAVTVFIKSPNLLPIFENTGKKPHPEHCPKNLSALFFIHIL